MPKYPIYKQPDTMDCGPTCIRMIASYYGAQIGLEQLKELTETTREGSNLLFLSKAAEQIGFRTLGVNVNFEKLQDEVPLPCIAHFDQGHFVVVYAVTRTKVIIGDPARGLVKLSQDQFKQRWISDPVAQNGVLLLFNPTPDLSAFEASTEKKGFGFLSHYIVQHKNLILQLIIGLFAGSLFQLIFPFLSQSIVDIGIQQHNLHFIYLILFAQLFLFIGKTSLDLFRSWILLFLSTKINVSLISDFFVKLMKLPISFFDSKMTGDLMQRIGDHKRIEMLITTTSLNVLFSFFSLVIFSVVLAWYNLYILGIFLLGSLLYVGWIVIFLKKRKALDHQRFGEMGKEQSKVIELINGMQEIKLHNAEQEKRWGWEFIQANLFKIEIKHLRLENFQSIGSNFINELKNMLITVFAAKLVIDGQLTLGMMLAITYIIGQLNSPLQQLLGFIYNAQDAKIALERLAEIHNKPDEEQPTHAASNALFSAQPIELRHVSYRYKGTTQYVLKGVNLQLQPGTTTAIVGASGSGKTTLMKMLLKFYDPAKGRIQYGSTDFTQILHSAWRQKCGVVMQEGYLFNDTIRNNIAIGAGQVNETLLKEATHIANIDAFIDSLPQGLDTQIGMEGMGISVGQKQRLLIARAVYKNPDILFFDEATSALDATNEQIIMENLAAFLEERTAVVIAHRLSTVRNADLIVVLEDGKIIEQGTHTTLINQQGRYFNLVKNQLDLERLHA